MLLELVDELFDAVGLEEVEEENDDDEEGLVEQSLLDAVLPDVELKAELLCVLRNFVVESIYVSYKTSCLAFLVKNVRVEEHVEGLAEVERVSVD